MKLKALLIDDETHSLVSLSGLLKDYCDDYIQIIGACDHPQKAIEIINKLQPDILFLDIQMPVLNGFRLLEKLDRTNFFLIFTTAHSEYAIRAIKASAFDYLMKPVNPKELLATVKRAHHLSKKKLNLKTHSDAQLLQAVDLLQRSIGQRAYPIHLMLRVNDGLQTVQVKSISHIEADINYSLVCLQKGTDIMTSKTLKSFQEVLDAQEFWRIHKSYIVNRSFIHKVIKKEQYFAELKSGQKLPIARRRARLVLDKLSAS